MFHSALWVAGLLLSLPLAGIAEPRIQVRPGRTDAYGDPLPTGAVARLGTSRWRPSEATQNAAFSPDGKRVLLAGRKSLFLFDFPSGRLHRQYAKALEQLSNGPMEFTADGQSVIFAGSEDSPICKLDLVSGTIQELVPSCRNSGLIDLAPGGRWGLSWLGDGTNCRFALHDFTQGAAGKEFANLPIPDAESMSCCLSSQGRFAAVVASVPIVGEEEIYCLTLIETGTGCSCSILLPPGRGLGRVAFSADEKELFYADSKELRRWKINAASKPNGSPEWQLVQQSEFPDENGILCLTVLSNGKQIITANENRTITLWDRTNGKLRKVWSEPAEFGGCGFRPLRFVLSPDGNSVALCNRDEGFMLGVRFRVTASGRELFPTFRDRESIEDLQFHPNGKVLAFVVRGEIHTWDIAPKRIAVQSSDEMPIEEERYPSRKRGMRLYEQRGIWFHRVAFDESGKIIFGLCGDRVWLGQMANRTLPNWIAPFGGKMSSFAVSSDGRFVAFILRSGGIELFDTVRDMPPKYQPELDSPIADLYFTPNTAKLTIITASGEWICWDCITSKKIPLGADVKPEQGQIARHRLVYDSAENRLDLWDRTSQRIVRRLYSVTGSYALSPDGRYIAHTNSSNGRLTICETNTMQVVRHWEQAVGSGFRLPLRFSPDGKLLAMAANDGSILLWDTHPPTPKTQPDAKALAMAWNDLASPEGEVAFNAIGVLQAAPQEALTLLKEKLRPAEEVDAGALTKLFRELDHDRYAVRQGAMFRLMESADRVEGDLQRQYAVASDEARWRLERVLASRTNLFTDSQTLRRLRAVEVLERIGTKEAKALLKKLAEGADGIVERSARDALARLDR